MATVIMQKWEGLAPDQYDALREIVGWDRDVPAGMRFHVASFGDGVLRMTDVWDSEELFGTFVQTRILPGLRQLGIPGQPDMITQAAHEVTAAHSSWGGNPNPSGPRRSAGRTAQSPRRRLSIPPARIRRCLASVKAGVAQSRSVHPDAARRLARRVTDRPRSGNLPGLVPAMWHLKLAAPVSHDVPSVTGVGRPMTSRLSWML
jgi:hypothetical protein